MMKRIATLGVLSVLVGCASADDMQEGLGEGTTRETSLAVSGLTSPFANNTTYALQQTQMDGQIRTVGFLFASPGTTPGVDQEQRWVLFTGYSLPLGAVRFEIPGPARRYTTLDAWKSAMTNGDSPLWRTGATYVKVTATNSPYASSNSGDECDWKTPGCQRYPQLVDEYAWISRVDADGKLIQQGFAQGGPLELVKGATDQMTNTEVWLSKPDYEAELSDTMPRLVLYIGPGIIDFVSFGEGSTKTLAHCTYFTTLPADL